jgi:hypothetical protein
MVPIYGLSTYVHLLARSRAFLSPPFPKHIYYVPRLGVRNCPNLASSILFTCKASDSGEGQIVIEEGKSDSPTLSPKEQKALQAKMYQELSVLSQKAELTAEDKKAFTRKLNWLASSTNKILEINTMSDWEVTKEELLELFKMLESNINKVSDIVQKFENSGYVTSTVLDIKKRFEEIFEQINDKLDETSRKSSGAGELAVNVIEGLLKGTLAPQLSAISADVQQLSRLLIQQKQVSGDASALMLKAPWEGAEFSVSEDSLDDIETKEYFDSEVPQVKTENSSSLGPWAAIPEDRKALLHAQISPILLKVKNREILTSQENEFLNSLKLHELVYVEDLSAGDDLTDHFRYSPGDVLQVVVTFKDNNFAVDTSKVISLESNQEKQTKMVVSMLNKVQHRVPLYYIVVQNDETLTVDKVLTLLHEKLFTNGLSHLMNSNVVLESIQVRRVFPTITKYGAHQKSFSTPGRLSTENFSTHLRPFVYVVQPSLVLGARNTWLTRFPGVCKEFSNFHGLSQSVLNLGVLSVARTLATPVELGPNKNLVIRGAIKVNRPEIPFKFLPIVSKKQR